MAYADFIVLGILVISAILGLLFGFGKLLKFFTGGIIGFCISLVVVYFCLGVVTSWSFVQALMAKMHSSMESANNGFLNFLLKINIEKVIIAICTFLIVQIIRILIVNIIKSIVEIDNKPMRVINKSLGMILMLGVAVMLILIVFQVVAWVGGPSAENMSNSLKAFNWAFTYNPLNSLFKTVG